MLLLLLNIAIVIFIVTVTVTVIVIVIAIEAHTTFTENERSIFLLFFNYFAHSFHIVFYVRRGASGDAKKDKSINTSQSSPVTKDLQTGTIRSQFVETRFC